jgi:light-independent protochlorophyllide reductase B subunit
VQKGAETKMTSEVKYFKGTVKELQRNIKAGIQQQDNPAIDTLRLCKLFGAYRCISELKGMLPLIHGPIGCACNNRFFVGLATVAHGFPMDLLMTCTDLTQNDVIFGGEEKLKQALLEVDRKYSPEVIAIFNTCAPGVIGDDIDAVADIMQPQVKARILPIHSEGYGHFNHYAGYRDAYEALVNHLVKPPTTIQENTINIVGDKNDYQTTDAMNDIRSLLKTLHKMGVKLHAVIPGGATVQQIEESASVSLNVMKCDSMAVDFCYFMKEKFGVEHTEATIPIGIEATVRWITEIGEKLNLQAQAKKAIDEELEAVMPYVERSRSVLTGKTVAVTGNYARAIAFLEFAMELGMKPVSLGLYGFNFAGEQMLDRLCERIDEDFEIVVGVSVHEQKEMIQRLKPDMFLADFREKPSSMEYGLASGDVPLGKQPQLGFEGVKFLSQCIANWSDNPLIAKYGARYGNERALCDSTFMHRCMGKRASLPVSPRSRCHKREQERALNGLYVP